MVAACSMQCASCATWTALSMHKRLQHACHYMLTQAHATHTHTQSVRAPGHTFVCSDCPVGGLWQRKGRLGGLAQQLLNAGRSAGAGAGWWAFGLHAL